MPRHIKFAKNDSPQTEAERLEELKLRVYAKYALNCLQNQVEDTLKKKVPEEISASSIELNAGRQRKAVRNLKEAGVIHNAPYRENLSGETRYAVNLKKFVEEAPSLAKLKMSLFQLDPKYLFENCLTSSSHGLHIDIHSIGNVELLQLGPRSTIWAFLHQDKVEIFQGMTSKIGNRWGGDPYESPHLKLKGSEKDVTRAQLQTILFYLIRTSPTEYLAKYCGMKWVGPVSSYITLHTHDKDNIIKNTFITLVKAEREMQKVSKHLTRYAEMIKGIRLKLAGKDQIEETVNFLKFAIKNMFENAPLHLHHKTNREYSKLILAHGEDFTFENLFPQGIDMPFLQGLLSGDK